MKHEISTLKAPGGEAKFVTYILDNSPDIAPGRQRPMVVLCPGGGYHITSDREAEPVALQLMARGLHVGILRYSCAPAEYPTALTQLALAMLCVRENAQAWNVDPAGIHIMGFSAGGHLAASLACLWNDPVLQSALPGHSPDAWRPKSAVLCYPVITAGAHAHQGSHQNLLGSQWGDAPLLQKLSLENSVTPATPPCFLWHTAEDSAVPVENSLLFATALQQAGVPFELHVYPKGEHGLSLGTEETLSADNPGWGLQPDIRGWIDLAARWIKETNA